MTTANVQVAIVPGFYPLSVYNASTTASIPEGSAVIIDAANNLNAATIANAHIAVTLPGTTTSAACVGITNQTIYAGGIGAITPVGPICRATCYGTVNGGSVVDNCTVTNYTGSVQAHVTGQRQLGIALAQGLNGETIPMILSAANNS